MGVMFGPQTPSTGHKSPMKLEEQKAFCLVNKGIQWQVSFACLNMCWLCVMMVQGSSR